MDGLRGLLALYVFAFHFTTGFIWSDFLDFLALVAVCGFFLLSGYVLTRSWDGRFAAFLVRRFVRLWPVFALSLGAGYWLAGVEPRWSEFFWYPIVDPNLEPKIDPPVWSLGVEAWAMIFMPIIVLCRRPGVAVATVAASLGAMAFNHYFLFGCLFAGGAALSHREFRRPWLETPTLQWLGKVSYSLYLTHYIVLKAGDRLGGAPGRILAVPAALAIAWLVWRLVERPSILLSRRVGRRPRRATKPAFAAPFADEQ